jgi:hypothetical protein
MSMDCWYQLTDSQYCGCRQLSKTTTADPHAVFHRIMGTARILLGYIAVYSGRKAPMF